MELVFFVYNESNGDVYQLSFENETARDMCLSGPGLLEVVVKMQLECGSLEPVFNSEVNIPVSLDTDFPDRLDSDSSPCPKRTCKQVTPKCFRTSETINSPTPVKKSLLFGGHNDGDLSDLATNLEQCSPFKAGKVRPAMSSRVLVENLPSPFFEDFFKYFVDQEIRLWHPESEITMKTLEYNSEKNSAVIHYSTPADAEAVSLLQLHLDGMPEDEMLVLTHLEEGELEAQKPVEPQMEVEVLTNEVTVSGTAFPFYAEVFTHMFKMHLQKNGINPGDFVKISDEDPNTRSIVVEFVSSDVATKVCNIGQQFKFRGSIHEFTQKIIKLNAFNIPFVMDGDVSQEDVTVGPAMSSRVLVENLPSPFFEGFFKFYVDDVTSFVHPDSGIAMKALVYNSEKNSAVIHYSTPADAEAVSLLQLHLDGMPEDEMLVLTHLEEGELEAQKPVEPQMEVEVLTNEVTVSGTSFPFYAEVFTHMFKMHLQNNGINPGDFVKISDEDPNTSSIVVEFVSSDIATKVCNIGKQFKFRGTIHKFTQKIIKLNTSVEGPSGSAIQSEIPHDGPIAYRTDWPNYESAQLMVLVNKHRTIMNNHRHKDYSKTWGIIQAEMAEKNLFYKEDVLRKRLKGINKYYPGSAENWPLRSLVEEYRGIIPLGTAKIPIECQKPAATSLNSKKSHGKKKHFGIVVMDNINSSDNYDGWDVKSDLKLIEEYKTRKPRFDDAQTKASTLYGEIEGVMKTAGYSQLNAERCCSRMADLAEKFREKYDQVRFQSGVGKDPTEWAYYDEFAKMYEGSAVLEPQRLVNMGSSYSVTTRTAPSSERHGRKDQPNKKVSPVSQKERRLLVGEGLLQQFTRMNDLLAKKNT